MSDAATRLTAAIMVENGHRTCRWCGYLVGEECHAPNGAPDDLRATLDHLLPRARGGWTKLARSRGWLNDEFSNVVLCCGRCNALRSAANHCMAAAACALAVEGADASLGAVARFLRPRARPSAMGASVARLADIWPKRKEAVS